MDISMQKEQLFLASLCIDIVFGINSRLEMIDEKQYEVANGLWIGSRFGDLRRERASLMKKLVHENDPSVKPRIRELTLEIEAYLSGKNK
jgi:hypothetical protein